jgi:hypothetical protein
LFNNKEYRMGKMAGQVRYAGDTGAVRKCLAKAGFPGWNPGDLGSAMFNDVAKSRATRRIKLWFASDVFDAPQKQQKRLERELKKEFGTRYLGGRFVNAGYQHYHAKSLCIRLTGY